MSANGGVDVLRDHAAAIVSIAKQADSTSVLRGIHSRGEGAEVRIGTDSGHVDNITSAVAERLPLSMTAVHQDVLNGGYELVVYLDKREERLLANFRAQGMLVPRLLRYSGVAVLAAAAATQALSNQRAGAIAPAVLNLINATLGNASAVLFEHALEAARETAGCYCGNTSNFSHGSAH